MSDDLLDLAVTGHMGDGNGHGRRRGRTSAREGQSSLLWMIRYELGQLSNPDDVHSPTNLQMVAKRLVQIALFGDDAVALRAMQLLLAYFEGEPRQLVQFEIVQAAKTIAQNSNLDPQQLIERAERIAAEAGF